MLRHRRYPERRHLLDVGAGGEDPLAAVEDGGADGVAPATPAAAAAAISPWTCALSAFIFGPSSRIVAIGVRHLNPHELAQATHLHTRHSYVSP